MPEVYNIFNLQVRYRTNSNRILELAKKHNAVIVGENFFLNNSEVKEFFDFLDLSLKANQLCHRANVLDAKKLYYDALLKYEEANKIIRYLGDFSIEATILNNIGLILESLGAFPQALTRFKKALNLVKELEDQLSITLQFENIARIYQKEKKFNEALKFFREFLGNFSHLPLEVKKGIKSHIQDIEKILQV